MPNEVEETLEFIARKRLTRKIHEAMESIDGVSATLERANDADIDAFNLRLAATKLEREAHRLMRDAAWSPSLEDDGESLKQASSKRNAANSKVFEALKLEAQAKRLLTQWQSSKDK